MYSSSTPKRLAHLSISLVVRAWDLAATAIGRGLPTRALGVIVLYHAVADRAAFARQLDHLARRGDLVPIGEFSGQPNGRWRIGVTFDDALADFVTNAWPELHSRRVPTTMFVPVGLLADVPGSPGHHEGQAVMSSTELVRLVGEGLEVGSHSVHHAHLRTLSDGRLTEELEKSVSELALFVNNDVRTHAFPYGEWDERTIHAARTAGYLALYGVEPLPVRHGDAVIGRVVIDPADWRIETSLKATGAYRWLGWWMRRSQRGRTEQVSDHPRAVGGR